ncbi:MAG: methylenetetrahydrofolate--tRNA-(uracil(54)-C(5))-methyltransferase (FADH(2)-oxidizing) TrmFO [Proteobacteria bacterium]|nr:methylenetetrahydrofolate--tRNA-(uracil(54)-C(5))-methyltransferase (FADH(2)-oxidizing) TrmFO [Pseudomonadota bacterium]
MTISSKIAVVGAGLAGCEVAWQLSTRKIPAVLFEMRPKTMTPAHQTGRFAELVCSNSFKSRETSNAHGLLKAEMEMAGSLIIECAKNNTVPAGSALAVDRALFSREIEQRLRNSSHIEFRNLEVTDIRDLQQDFPCVVVASGPLSSDALATSLHEMLGEDGLFFYDSIAPVVTADSIDMDIAYKASRYGKGEADYINCPLNREQYEDFIDDLLRSEKVPFKQFEQARHFEGCLPIEVMAERGPETLSFGPMKPVGLEDPRTGKRPWAVLQLRRENKSGTLYNLVGCQTRLTWPEQKKVFRRIPGLERCEFARLGSMHRNTYINAPKHLNPSLELIENRGIFLAGQITGVEGYTESAATGLWAAMNLAALRKGTPQPEIDTKTMMGALINYLNTASPQGFQPMNSNFGLLAPFQGKKRVNKKEKRTLLAQLALKQWRSQLGRIGWDGDA